jgi:hypothetical protein
MYNFGPCCVLHYTQNDWGSTTSVPNGLFRRSDHASRLQDCQFRAPMAVQSALNKLRFRLCCKLIHEFCGGQNWFPNPCFIRKLNISLGIGVELQRLYACLFSFLFFFQILQIAPVQIQNYLLKL